MTEKFGNTWWGKQWLNAFHQIDYNTRLPRGRAYASQRAVLHLHWEQAQEPNPVLYAQVKGSRAEPYSQMIRWPSFSEAEKQQMLTLLSQQPDWQAQLARQEFPPALYRALEQRSLRLFIEKWEDVQAQCTCPDWQVPCKHLAAVIYTLANEIDQNPALIFKSRGLDLTLPSPTQSTRSLNDAFADWKSFFSSEPPASFTLPATDIGEINFSLIPQSTDQIMALLTDTPTFYAPYNLKIYMLNTYQETARQARQWQQTDLYQRYSDWPDNPDAVRIYIDENFRYRRTQFIRGDHAFSWDTRQDINDLLNALRSFPTEASYLPTLRVLYRHLAFATELATQGAYVPQLIRLKSQKFLIRWVPALRIPIVKTLFDQLVALTPPCTLVHFTRQQLCYPDGAEQVRSLLALFLNHLVRTAFRNPNPNGYDPLLFHFFTQQSLENKSAQQRNLLRAIYEWIAPLHQLHPQ